MVSSHSRTVEVHEVLTTQVERIHAYGVNRLLVTAR